LPLFVLLVSLSFVLPSCNKEDNIYEDIPDYSSKNSSVTIDRVKNHFSKYKAAPTSSFDGDQLILPRNAKPIWSLAKETIFNGNTEIVIVPILPISKNTRWNAYQNGRIVFYEKPNGQIGENLLLFHSHPKLFDQNVKPTNANYSGLIYQIDENGYLRHPSIVKKGKIIKEIPSSFFNQFDNQNSSNVRNDDPLGCKVKNRWWVRLGEDIYNWFDRIDDRIDEGFEDWFDWFHGLFNGASGSGSGPGSYPNEVNPGNVFLGGNWSFNPNGIYPKPPALDWPNVEMDLDILFKTGIFSDWSIALPYIAGLEVIKFRHDIHITTRQLYIELAECYGINWEATLEENPTFENIPPFTADLEWNQGNSGSSTSSSGIVPFEIIITFAHTPYAELGDCEKAIVDKYDPDKNGVNSYVWAKPWLLEECEEVYTEIVNILPSLRLHCNVQSINQFLNEALHDEDCSSESFYCKLSRPDTPSMSTCAWQAVQSDVCQNAAANFINKYKLSISVAELDALVGEGKFCGCEETYNCKANKLLFFAREDIKEIIDNNLLKDPCNPEISSQEIITNSFNNNCEYDFGLKSLTHILSDIIQGHDWIVEDPKSFTQQKCPILVCLYNKMLQQNINFVCSYVAPTFDSDKFKLTIKVQDTEDGSTAYATYNHSTKSATLVFDPFNCNKEDEVSLMSTILHEFVHVELMRKMAEKGYNFNDFSNWKYFYPNLADYFENLAKANSDPSEIHHYLMLSYENIIDKQAKALFEIFKGQSNGLTKQHFYLVAAGGLFYAMEQHNSSVPGFNTLYGEFINKYEPLYNFLKTKNLSIGCN